MLIFLVGYMGSGKSTIGKLLAAQLGASIVESDIYIQHIESMSVNDIFKSKGESYFRNLESAFLFSLKPGNMVVSTGGGLPCYNDNMKIMNKTGMTIYLDVPVELLLKRLSNAQDRPLLHDYNDEQLKEFITTHLEERKAFYNQSKLVVDGSLSPKEVVEKIMEHF